MPENGHKTVSEIIEEWTPIEEALDKAFLSSRPPASRSERAHDLLR
jgi:hypothetical protein